VSAARSLESFLGLTCPNSCVRRMHVVLVDLFSLCPDFIFFSALQTKFIELASFVSKVLLISYGPNFALLRHCQPPLLISGDSSDTHHALIGTFLPFTFVNSDKKDSGNSHSGACMPFARLGGSPN
jgi:hypothetical protein